MMENTLFNVANNILHRMNIFFEFCIFINIWNWGHIYRIIICIAPIGNIISIFEHSKIRKINNKCFNYFVNSATDDWLANI